MYEGERYTDENKIFNKQLSYSIEFRALDLCDVSIQPWLFLCSDSQ